MRTPLGRIALTDLANPSSNKINFSVSYRPLADVTVIEYSRRDRT